MLIGQDLSATQDNWIFNTSEKCFSDACVLDTDSTTLSKVEELHDKVVRL